MATRPSGRGDRVRQVASWVLAVLAAVACVLALLSVWVFRTFTDTDLFVDRVGSVIEQPEVAAAVADAAAAELVEGLDVQERVAGLLPGPLDAVAGPLAGAAQNYLAQGAQALVATERFQQAWEESLAATHRLSVTILSGEDTAAVQNSDGVVVLDLTPVVDALVAQSGDFLSDLFGRPISAPGVSGDDPRSTITALQDALGVDLAADFGQVVLVESSNLAAAQQGFQAARVAVWLAPVVAVALVGLAIAVSTSRRRTALAVVVGVSLLLLIVALATEPVKSAVVGGVSDSGLGSGVAAAFDSLLSPLVTGIVVVGLLGLVVSAVSVAVVLVSRRQRERNAFASSSTNR